MREERREARIIEEARSRGPLDTTSAREARRKMERSARKEEEERNREKLKAKWSMSFAEAYRAAQEARKAFGDVEGPLDIGDRKNRRLLVLLLAQGGPAAKSLDWERISERWGVERPVLEVVKHVRYLEKFKKTLVAPFWRRIDAAMEAQGIPKRSALRLRLEPGANEGVARSMVDSVLGKACDVPLDVRTWVHRNLELRKGARLSFYELRNAAATVRRMDVEETKEKLYENRVGVFMGQGLERIPGSAKVPVRLPNVVQVRESRAPAQSLRRILQHWSSSPLPEVELSDKNHERITGEATKQSPEVRVAYDEYAALYGDRIGEVLREREERREKGKGKGKGKTKGDKGKGDKAEKGRGRGKGEGKRDDKGTRTEKRERGKGRGKGRGKEEGDGDEGVYCPDDKDPKSTWKVPRKIYEGIVLTACITAGWILLTDAVPSAVEFGLKGYMGDHLPPRMRNLLGSLMHSGLPLLPYLYVSIKSKCFAGPPDARRTCEEEGHSCTRKIVSFVQMWGRAHNRLFHRCGQTVLQRMPTWEVWDMGAAPKMLHEGYEELTYDPLYRHCCLKCQGFKKVVSNAVMDAGQAYEQIEPATAREDFRWDCEFVKATTGKETVTYVRENPASSYLGGVVTGVLALRAIYVVLMITEVHAFISILFMLTYVRVGNSIWKTPGTCIGNPVGRLALACTTGRDEVEYDSAWRSGTLKDEKMNTIARSGLTRKQVVALAKYADDWNAMSLLLCVACLMQINADTYRITFAMAKDSRRFLDMRELFLGGKGKGKPRLVLQLVLKNEETLLLRRKEWAAKGVAPWWCPYTKTILSGIFRGYTIRAYAVLPSDKARLKFLGRMTTEFILRGYKIKALSLAWAMTPWGEERRTMMSRLRSVRRLGLGTEGQDWIETRAKIVAREQPVSRVLDSSSRGSRKQNKQTSAVSGDLLGETCAGQREERNGTKRKRKRKRRKWLTSTMATDGSNGSSGGGGDGNGQRGRPPAPYYDRNGVYHVPGIPGQGKKRQQSGGWDNSSNRSQGRSWYQDNRSQGRDQSQGGRSTTPAPNITVVMPPMNSGGGEANNRGRNITPGSDRGREAKQRRNSSQGAKDHGRKRKKKTRSSSSSGSSSDSKPGSGSTSDSGLDSGTSDSSATPKKDKKKKKEKKTKKEKGKKQSKKEKKEKKKEKEQKKKDAEKLEADERKKKEEEDRRSRMEEDSTKRWEASLKLHDDQQKMIRQMMERGVKDCPTPGRTGRGSSSGGGGAGGAPTAVTPPPSPGVLDVPTDKPFKEFTEFRMKTEQAMPDEHVDKLPEIRRAANFAALKDILVKLNRDVVVLIADKLGVAFVGNERGRLSRGDILTKKIGEELCAFDVSAPAP